MRRVVVTGMGAVTPFGFGVDKFWHSLLESKNGISTVKSPQLRGDIVKIAGCLPEADLSHHKKQVRTLFSSIPEDDNVNSYFLAVYEAMTSAGLDPREMHNTDHIAPCIADRKLNYIEYVDSYASLLKQATDEHGKLDENRYFLLLREAKIGKKTPFNDPDSINHFLARQYNITGPQLSVATACASSNTAIGEAFIKIKHGHIDIAIAGGAYHFDLSSMIGFTRIGAMTQNPDPETACRPFDLNRDGFVMGSGCGVMILEEFELAKKRGASILCEIRGYGYFSDAYRPTDPDPEAKAASQTIKSCLDLAQVNVSSVGYINAHGTSTKMNDLTETIAIKNVFKEHANHIPVSSTKSMIGHSILAAAALEGIVCIKSINEGTIHPTRNWMHRDPALDLDYVPDGPREVNLEYALSNSFGFGGQNTSILYARI